MAPGAQPIYGRDMTETTPSHVLIAGGGVAALETLIALRDLAGDRVAITLLAPETTFTYRPMKVAEPFYLGHARDVRARRDRPTTYGAGFVRDSIAEVRADEKLVRCASGRDFPTTTSWSPWAPRRRPRFRARDHVRRRPGRGAPARPARRPRAGLPPQRRVRRPGRGDVDAAALRARADDRPPGVGHGHGRRPLHARHARGPPARHVRRRPPATRSRELLDRRTAIEFVGSSYPTVGRGYVIADPGGRRIDAERVGLAARRSTASRLAGVPADDSGFIPVDAARPRARACRTSTRRVTAPTSRSSRAASRHSRPTPWRRRSRPRPARDVEPEPFRPVLRGCCSPAATTAICATPSPAAAARARSSGTRCGGRRRRSPAATSPATSSAATTSRPSRRSAGSPRGRDPAGRARRGPPGLLRRGARPRAAVEEVCDALGVDARAA